MKGIHPIHFLVLLLVFALGACAASGPVRGTGPAVVGKGYEMERLAKDTPFPGVNGAAIGADGDLYVTHTGNGSITRIDLDTMMPSVFVAPSGATFIVDDIASDPYGRLYATGTTPLVGEVYRIGPEGVKTVIASGMAAPNGIEYNDTTDRLFVTECFQGNRVYEVDPDGTMPARLLIGENVIPVPEGFDYDPNTNDLIIPDMGTGKILRVDPDSGAIRTVAEQFVTPIALTIGADKMIYIPELATGAVYKLSLDGRTREKIAQLKPGLDNVAMTKGGRLFVTSYWDATIYEVSTDGSGDFSRLFPEGPNQPLGVVAKGDDIYVADAIMLRTVRDGKYQQTELNAWAVQGMPLPLSLADGPGDKVFWTDCVHGAVSMGDPVEGSFQPLAGGLDLPMSALLDPGGERLYVAEYGAGRITAINLAEGSKSMLASELEGPLAMATLGDTLYVAESRPGRISAVDMETGEKEVFVSSAVGKPGALADDGEGNLLVLDGAGRQLLRIDPESLDISVVAVHLPVQYSTVGSYPSVEFPLPMDVADNGDIYITTAERGLLRLKTRE